MKHCVLFLTFLALMLSLCSCTDNTTEVSALRADMSVLLEDVSELKSENEELKATIQSMSEQMKNLYQQLSFFLESSKDSYASAADIADFGSTEPISGDSGGSEVLDAPSPSVEPAQAEVPTVSPEPEISTSPMPDVTYPEAANTVFITASGSRYHYSSSCGSGTYFECTLEEALAKGLTACKKCAGG